MYNTYFKVKYADIEHALLTKLKRQHPELYPSMNQDDDDDSADSKNDYNYTVKDVTDICNKLYMDEFLQVFGAEDMDDDRLNTGIKYVYDVMMENEFIKNLLNEMTQICIDSQRNKCSPEMFAVKRRVLLVTFFSQPIFHIMHKCVCQQIEMKAIDPKLLDELKRNSLDILKQEPNFSIADIEPEYDDSHTNDASGQESVNELKVNESKVNESKPYATYTFSIPTSSNVNASVSNATISNATISNATISNTKTINDDAPTCIEINAPPAKKRGRPVKK